MPSGYRLRERGVGSNVDSFRTRTPHFVKVVLSGSLRRGKMQIPPRFRRYLNSFSDAVKLKLPNDDVWSVKLELSEGNLWLGKGWRKLQDHYRLTKGSLLLFHWEGEGKAVFHVSIFDRSCTEIDYPVKITSGVWTEPSNNSISSESEDSSDDSLEIDYISSADSVSNNHMVDESDSPESECKRPWRANKPMPSGSRRSRRGVRSNVGFFKPKSPHFIKVMLPDTVRRGKIEIPPKFARKYGGNFSKAVELTVPSHDAWLVKLKLSEGNFWLRKGWKDFQSHYPLETGSFLLFQLDGHSAFQVLIFDESGTEIDYPLKNAHRVRPEPSNHFLPSEMEDDSDDSLADSGPLSKKRQYKHRTRRLSPSELVPIDITDSSSADSMSSHEQYESNSPRRSAGKPRCFREPLPPGSQKALEAAKEFHTNGFSFHIQMRKSYMRSGGVSISKNIMQTANLEEGFHRVELRHDGEAWPVKMLCYKQEHRGKLCRGWLDFLNGNDVKAGDVCVFELLKTNVFDVHIIRCS